MQHILIMKNGIKHTYRLVLSFLLIITISAQMAAQVSSPPPCDGPLTIYFSVSYLGCDNPGANAKVIPNCGTLPFSYQWSNGTISAEILNVLPGTYTATVTDAKGLKAIGSVVVPTAPATNLSVSAVINGGACTSGATGSVTLTMNGGTAPYDVKWYTNPNNTNIKNDQSSPFVISNLAPGSYTIVVTDERYCRDTIKAEIKAGLVVTATSSPVTCTNPNAGKITLNIGTPGGTAPYTISGAGPAAITTSTFPFSISNLTAGNYTLTVTDANGCTGTVSSKVETALDVVLTATAPSNPVCGGQDLSINLGNSGIAPYLVSWEGPNGFVGSTTTNTFPVVLKNVPPGNYTVKVTDATGCTGVETTTTGGNPVMQITATATPVSCTDSKAGTITVNFITPGNPNYTLSWSGGSQALSNLPFTISGLSAATYVITITDSKGCTATTTTKVESALDVVLVASAPSNPLCGGSDLKIDLNGFKGTAPYDLAWDGPGQFDGTANDINLPFTLKNVPSGTYTITVTDVTGCTGTETIEIKNTKEPLLIIATGTQVSCQNDKDGTVTLTTVFPGTAPYRVSWSGNEITGALLPLTINNLAPGNYCFTVTDANGCTATACARVETALDVTLTAKTPVLVNCGGVDLEIDINGFKGTLPYKITWDGPGSFDGMQSGVTTLPFVLKNVPSGTYHVTITDATGCSGTETLDVKAGNEPMIIAAVGTQVSCGLDDGMITLTMLSPGTAPYTITWTGGTAVPNATFPFKFNDLKPGEYCFTVTDANGCTATACATVKFALDVKLTVIEGTQLCGGGSLIVDVIGFQGMAPYKIELQGPTSGTKLNVPSLPDTIQGLQPGKYTVILTDKNGCSGLAMATIKGDTMMQVSLAPTDLLCTGNGKDGKITVAISNPKTAPYAIGWNTGSISGVNTNQFPFTIIELEANTYTVTVTDANGCSSTASTTIKGGPVDITLLPTSDVKACIDSTIQLKINNLDPKDLLIFEWTANSTNITITPSNGDSPIVKATEPGTYIITLTTKNQFNCIDVKTINVTFDSVQNIDPTLVVNPCNGLLVKFENNSGKNGTWTFGDGKSSTEPSPTHLYEKAGNYTVTFAAAEDCVKKFSKEIKVIDVEAVQTDFNIKYKDCSDKAEIQFNDATKFAAVGVSWEWTFDPPQQSSSLQNPTITFTKEDTIKVRLIVKDNNGCLDTLLKEVKVDFIADKIDKEFKFCPGDSIELNKDGAVVTDIYTWTSNPADPTLVSNLPNPKVSPVTTTTYNLTIMTPDSACSVDFSAEAIVIPTVSGALPKDTVLCNANPFTINLISNNATNIIWSGNKQFDPVIGTGNSVTINPEKNGVYYVKATNQSDCPLLDSIIVNDGSVNMDPGSKDQRICLGETAILNLSNLDPSDILTYKWTPEVTPPAQPEVKPTTETKYGVVVTNQFGCTATAEFNVDVIAVDVVASIDGKDTICIGETAKLIATITSNKTPVQIAWTPANTLTGANTATPIAKPQETTTYTVRVTYDDELCPVEDQVTLFVRTDQCVEPFIFVPKAFTPNGDGNNDRFVFRGVNLTEVEFIVWDRWGEKVYETTDVNDLGWDGSYRGNSLTPDSYAFYFKARCGNGAFYEKKGNVTLLK